MCARRSSGAGSEMNMESDMVANYRVIAAFWLALCLLVAVRPAFPDTLKFGELRLAVESPWQRAEIDEEQSADSVILRQPGADASLEVYLPRRREQLKTDPEAFFQQLDQGWKLRYGEAAVLSWWDSGGTRWRLCRRLSLDSNAVLFQLVTVRGAEAYQVVAVTPPGTATLPDAVQTLLLGGTWAEAQPIMATAKVTPQPVAATAQATPQPVAAVVPAKSWRLLRQVAVHPGKGQWGQLAKAERTRLGANEVLTSLGLKVGIDGLNWFLEGRNVTHHKAGATPRPSHRARWRINWPPLAELWREGENQTINLRFANEADKAVRRGNNFAVRYELIGVCAPRPTLVAWLNSLEQGQPGAMSQMELLAAGCQKRPAGPSPVTVMSGGASASRQAVLRLPVAWADAIRAKDGGSVRRFLLVMSFMASQTGRAPGDALLSQAAVVSVFGPDD